MHLTSTIYCLSSSFIATETRLYRPRWRTSETPVSAYTRVINAYGHFGETMLVERRKHYANRRRCLLAINQSDRRRPHFYRPTLCTERIRRQRISVCLAVRPFVTPRFSEMYRRNSFTVWYRRTATCSFLEPNCNPRCYGGLKYT